MTLTELYICVRNIERECTHIRAKIITTLRTTPIITTFRTTPIIRQYAPPPNNPDAEKQRGSRFANTRVPHFPAEGGWLSGYCANLCRAFFCMIVRYESPGRILYLPSSACFSIPSPNRRPEALAWIGSTIPRLPFPSPCTTTTTTRHQNG